VYLKEQVGKTYQWDIMIEIYEHIHVSIAKVGFSQNYRWEENYEYKQYEENGIYFEYERLAIVEIMWLEIQ
jgi:hypothetical protein